VPALAACAAAVALSGALAGPAAADGTPTPAPTCGQNDLGVVATNAGSHPTASAVGAKVVDSVTLKNVGPTDLQGVFFSFSFGPVQGPTTTPPSFWWQLDGAGWQTAGASWNNSWNAGPWPAWAAGARNTGSFQPGSTHTLEFAVAFVSSSQAGSYTSVLAMGASSCGYELVHTSMNLAFTPPPPPKPTTPAAANGSGAASTMAAAAGSSPTAPQTSGSATASPSPSDGASAATSSTGDADSPSADVTSLAAAAASDAHAGGGSTGSTALTVTLVALVVLLAAGATAGIVIRRRRRRPTETV
jgi:hypothetical protein